MPLNTRAHLASYDDLYEALIGAHQGLTTEESHAMNVRLVLLLANHVGDLDVLHEALRLARGRPAVPDPDAPAAVTPVSPAHATR